MSLPGPIFVAGTSHPALPGLCCGQRWRELRLPWPFSSSGFGLNPPFDLGSESPVFAWFPGMVVAFVVVLFAARRYQVPRLVMLDAVAPAAALGYAAERIAWFLVRTSGHPEEIVPIPRFATAAVYEFVAGLLICWFLWHEGRRATQWQRPNGIVAGRVLHPHRVVVVWDGIYSPAISRAGRF